MGLKAVYNFFFSLQKAELKLQCSRKCLSLNFDSTLTFTQSHCSDWWLKPKVKDLSIFKNSSPGRAYIPRWLDEEWLCTECLFFLIVLNMLRQKSSLYLLYPCAALLGHLFQRISWILQQAITMNTKIYKRHVLFLYVVVISQSPEHHPPP